MGSRDESRSFHVFIQMKNCTFKAASPSFSYWLSLKRHWVGGLGLVGYGYGYGSWRNGLAAMLPGALVTGLLHSGLGTGDSIRDWGLGTGTWHASTHTHRLMSITKRAVRRH